MQVFCHCSNGILFVNEPNMTQCDETGVIPGIVVWHLRFTLSDFAIDTGPSGHLA